MKKKVCFFSTVPKINLLSESYSILDIRILEELGFDVIIANKFYQIPFGCDLYFSWWASGSILPLIKALISNKPLICVAGGNEVMLYRDSISNRSSGYLSYSFIKKLAVRIVLKFSKKILVVSSFMVDSVNKLGRPNPIVVFNCVDTDRLRPIEKRESYILSVFKLDESVVEIKRGDIYLHAIAEVVKYFPDQKFYIIGKFGNALNRLKSKLVQFNIENNVVFVNEVKNSDLVSWLQNAQLYVQISDTETFGLTIAEAMSCETPVLVSRMGAIPEVVGELGIYVNHNSYLDVSLGIINFLKLSTTEKKALGKNLRSRIVHNFSYQTRKYKLKEIIEKVM